MQNTISDIYRWVLCYVHTAQISRTRCPWHTVAMRYLISRQCGENEALKSMYICLRMQVIIWDKKHVEQISNDRQMKKSNLRWKEKIQTEMHKSKGKLRVITNGKYAGLIRLVSLKSKNSTAPVTQQRATWRDGSPTQSGQWKQVRSQGWNGGNFSPNFEKLLQNVSGSSSFWCMSPRDTIVQINKTDQGTDLFSAFSRTWSKQYGFDYSNDVYSGSVRESISRPTFT